jgi:DNA polymerase-1
METFHFIDGNYLMHRAIHKGQGLFYNGIFTGGAYIFLRVLFSLGSLRNIIVVFDGGHSERRKQLLETYKVKEKYDDEFKEQFSVTQKILKELLPPLGIAIVQVENQEADDIIYWLSTKHFSNSIVHTDDEDYLQLLQWGIKIHRPIKGEYYESADDFVAKYGYHPKYLALKKAIMGDPSDNIPGVRGIGDKRASMIVKEMAKQDLSPEVSALETLLKGKKEIWAKRILENLDIVERNLQLIDFRFVDLTGITIQVKFENFDVMQTTKLMKKYGFKSLVTRLVEM